VNLSVITGIILGPWLAIIAALIVNILMALVGHGGITVVGLNTIVVGFEAVAGYAIFGLLKRVLRPGLAAGLSTVAALFLSTCLMLFIVLIANVDFNVEAAHGLREVIEAPTVGKLMGLAAVKEGFNFRFFAYAAFGLGALGWSIEALVTGAAVRFISLVKPDLVK
jgi:cobalt/nickel transport system permease protein